MEGQWYGSFDGEFGGTLRIELEDRGEFFIGRAYLFYASEHRLPGFQFNLSIPKNPPHSAIISPLYLYANGGVMTGEERTKAEEDITARFDRPMPTELQVQFQIEDDNLAITWNPLGDDNSEVISIPASKTKSPSTLPTHPDLTSWELFREWAIGQRPRRFIFRGQSKPYRLVTSFHRTWRKDLLRWIEGDVKGLFWSVAESVNYPLRMGELDHNSAVWSILQHHGYPTPLLDWSFSPFVAASFAFQKVEAGDDSAPRIYIFDQEEWGKRYGQSAFVVDPAPPQLVVMESPAIGNPRSAPQQAVSTVTNIADVESFIQDRAERDGFQYLTVCNLAPEDGPRIKRELELMGITYGTLFPGLDGTCRDMKERNFERS